MLDLAYLTEANITYAEIWKERIWKEVLNSDLSKPFGPVFLLMGDIDLCNRVINYWSIMYYTHGV